MHFTYLGIKKGSVVQVFACNSNLLALAQIVVLQHEQGKSLLNLAEDHPNLVVDYDLIGVMSNHFDHFIESINELNPQFPKESEILADGTKVTYHAEWLYYDADLATWFTEDTEITTNSEFNKAYFAHNDIWSMYEQTAHYLDDVVVKWMVQNQMTINHGGHSYQKYFSNQPISSTWSFTSAKLQGPIAFKTVCHCCNTFEHECKCTTIDLINYTIDLLVPF